MEAQPYLQDFCSYVLMNRDMINYMHLKLRKERNIQKAINYIDRYGNEAYDILIARSRDTSIRYKDRAHWHRVAKLVKKLSSEMTLS